MRILLLQLKRIGDLILTTPALWALRQHFPEARIVLAVEAGSRAAAAGHRFRGSRRSSTTGAGKTAPSGGTCSLTTTMSASISPARTAPRFSPCFPRRRAGCTFEWVQRSRFRHVFYNQFVASSVRENHTADHYLHLLRALGLPVQEWRAHRAASAGVGFAQGRPASPGNRGRRGPVPPGPPGHGPAGEILAAGAVGGGHPVVRGSTSACPACSRAARMGTSSATLRRSRQPARASRRAT